MSTIDALLNGATGCLAGVLLAAACGYIMVMVGIVLLLPLIVLGEIRARCKRVTNPATRTAATQVPTSADSAATNPTSSSEGGIVATPASSEPVGPVNPTTPGQSTVKKDKLEPDGDEMPYDKPTLPSMRPVSAHASDFSYKNGSNKPECNRGAAQLPPAASWTTNAPLGTHPSVASWAGASSGGYAPDSLPPVCAAASPAVRPAATYTSDNPASATPSVAAAQATPARSTRLQARRPRLGMGPRAAAAKLGWTWLAAALVVVVVVAAVAVPSPSAVEALVSAYLCLVGVCVLGLPLLLCCMSRPKPRPSAPATRATAGSATRSAVTMSAASAEVTPVPAGARSSPAEPHDSPARATRANAAAANVEAATPATGPNHTIATRLRGDTDVVIGAGAGPEVAPGSDPAPATPATGTIRESRVLGSEACGQIDTSAETVRNLRRATNIMSRVRRDSEYWTTCSMLVCHTCCICITLAARSVNVWTVIGIGTNAGLLALTFVGGVLPTAWRLHARWSGVLSGLAILGTITYANWMLHETAVAAKMFQLPLPFRIHDVDVPYGRPWAPFLGVVVSLLGVALMHGLGLVYLRSAMAQSGISQDQELKLGKRLRFRVNRRTTITTLTTVLVGYTLTLQFALIVGLI